MISRTDKVYGERLRGESRADSITACKYYQHDSTDEQREEHLLSDRKQASGRSCQKPEDTAIHSFVWVIDKSPGDSRTGAAEGAPSAHCRDRCHLSEPHSLPAMHPLHFQQQPGAGIMGVEENTDPRGFPQLQWLN